MREKREKKSAQRKPRKSGSSKTTIGSAASTSKEPPAGIISEPSSENASPQPSSPVSTPPSTPPSPETPQEALARLKRNEPKRPSNPRKKDSTYPARHAAWESAVTHWEGELKKLNEQPG